jgi:hypothetical protein
MNPYFLHQQSTAPEFDLYKNAANEIIEQRGLLLKFLPRSIIANDLILGDTVSSKFESSVDITAYLENFTSFDGSGNLFGSFGFEMTDQLTLLISSISLDKLDITLKESDILYHVISNRMFEIADIKNTNSFFQFGGDEIWKKIFVKPFNSSFEEFETGDTDIDILNNLSDTNTTDEIDILSTARDLFLED